MPRPLRDLRVLVVLAATLFSAPGSHVLVAQSPSRPKGPCDIYAAAGDPCVAAHSTTRALYSSYNGPLYQVSTAGGGRGGGGGAPQPITVTVAQPLKFAHAVGAQVAGKGITLTTALTKTHAAGTRVASAAPTPGAPNRYVRKQ